MLLHDRFFFLRNGLVFGSVNAVEDVTAVNFGHATDRHFVNTLSDVVLTSTNHPVLLQAVPRSKSDFVWGV